MCAEVYTRVAIIGPRRLGYAGCGMPNVKAIYPGTFDPLTNGHLDLIARGAKIVDHLVVAILRNADKGSPLFSVEERLEMIREAIEEQGFKNVSADTFDGLLVEYARSQGAQAVLLDRVGDELLGGDRVRVLLLPRRGEGAELALHAADVRLVQVEVLDEEDLVAAAADPARVVGEVAEREQVVGLEQRDAVLEVEALACVDLLADRSENVERVENCH